MKNRFTRLLAAILLAALLVPVFSTTAFAAQGQEVKLRAADTAALVPFRVTNLFPGESVTKDFVIEVDHTKPITLHYHADIRPGQTPAGEAALEDVLKTRIYLVERNVTLYDGLMKDMPSSVDIQLAASEKTVTYRITVYLDTSVGNPYMNKTLIADFRWWYLDEEGEAVTVVAEKTLDDKYARGSKFVFELLDEQGKVLDTVRNDDGHIEFDTLYFHQEGTYTYTIREVKGTDNTITYDDAVYKLVVNVTVTDGQRGHTVTWYRNGKLWDAAKTPRFTNAKKLPMPGDPDDVDPGNPKMGDDFPLMFYSIVAVTSLTLLVCLWILYSSKRKEEEA